MNKHVNSTAVANTATEFPIEYANQHPGDDLHHALNMLDLVLESMEDDKRAIPAFTALCVVKERIRPLLKFLDKLDYDSLLSDYAAARRAVILESWEAGQ